MKLYISTGNSRMEKRWNGAEMELDEFIERISHTIRTAETVEQYVKMTKAKQDAIKDVGGFVMGKLKGGRRKKGLNKKIVGSFLVFKFFVFGMEYFL